MLKIKFKNLGPLKSGEVIIKDMTVFCGKNNTGKTYVNYLIYSVLETLKNYKAEFNLDITQLLREGIQEIDVVSLFENNFDRVVKEIANEVRKNLYKVFNSKKEFFKDLELEIELNKEQKRFELNSTEIKETFTRGQDEVKILTVKKMKHGKHLLLVYYLKEDLGEFILDYLNNFLTRLLINENKEKYMLPTERNGLNIFYNEILKERFSFVEEFKNISFPTTNNLKKISSYPKPVKDYLNILTELNKYDKIDGNRPLIDIAEEMEKEIIKGKYKIDNNRIFYQTENKKELDLYMASSTVKTIFGVIFYLRHLIKEKDYLIIDEPELNLHPENQVKIARLLVRLVNSGVKVIISTHSDYITKEFNNLLMLDNDFKNKTEIMERYGYSEKDILRKNSTGAYLFKDGTMNEMEIGEEGIITKTFDEVIESINERNDDIYYSLKESGDE